MHAVVETPEFLHRAKHCGVSESEREEIISHISANPLGGDLIPGTGGARKIRFARPGQGKRGGYRIITYYGGVDIPIFLLSIFTKNEQSNLSQSGKNELRKILAVLPENYRGLQNEKRQKTH